MTKMACHTVIFYLGGLQDLRATGHRPCYRSDLPAPHADSLLRDMPFCAV